jgi:hypothetical protein
MIDTPVVPICPPSEPSTPQTAETLAELQQNDHCRFVFKSSTGTIQQWVVSPDDGDTLRHSIPNFPQDWIPWGTTTITMLNCNAIDCVVAGTATVHTLTTTHISQF